ncbi:hypothetical protein Scep_028459 [Stephania cephalantha]|uniref:Uncharacterized protein n=1 Tax=Stephania cephalantha TaxID=152367 RepID=A0AAP0ED76_9MAGN
MGGTQSHLPCKAAAGVAIGGSSRAWDHAADASIPAVQVDVAASGAVASPHVVDEPGALLLVHSTILEPINYF